MSAQLGSCAAVHSHLHAFADGELRGSMLRSVSQHVESCGRCAAAIAEISELGNLLRRGVDLEAEPPDLAGLADGVVSRVRAEDHESWRGLLERATDDLHWVMVGVGSVAAAFMSALVVSVVVQSGVGQRADSLAAMLNTLATAPPALGRATVVPASLGALVSDGTMFISLAEVNDDGHVLSLESLSQLDKKDAAILTEMRRMRFEEQQDRRMTDPNGRLFVWVVSSTQVRGKIL
jgi:hypothetical protein